jgi:hypothetical protein
MKPNLFRRRARQGCRSNRLPGIVVPKGGANVCNGLGSEVGGAPDRRRYDVCLFDGRLWVALVARLAAQIGYSVRASMLTGIIGRFSNTYYACSQADR